MKFFAVKVLEKRSYQGRSLVFGETRKSSLQAIAIASSDYLPPLKKTCSIFRINPP
ncbi:hypothetical protein NG796_13085 [Laspinema sp. A4]|uniref:hypothetical protein n=1 Tax=Laspinema sp. D2d TaxID=2953686 RepID=UPI0021BA6A99|nr:hypothetical protein [Laspinema sp. D2d]MCT7984230.1 hypothetical protein [Laspinema sp. D2d]